MPLGIAVVLIAFGGVYVAGRRSAPSPGAARSAPSASPTALPSALRTLPELLPVGHQEADWKEQHGKSGSRACAICHRPQSCLGCHGTEMPHSVLWPQVHGQAAVADSAVCSRCHEDRQKECASCHSITMPHPANWVSSGHRIAAAPGSERCVQCHTRTDCAGCHELRTATSCARCHADKVTALGRAGGHEPGLCVTCHGENTSVIGPGKEHRRTPSCLSCHDASKLAPGGGIESARAWNGKNGTGLGMWAEPGRGRHSQADLTRCAWCHDVHDAKTPKYPPGTNPKSKNCAPACHEWVGGTVVQRGFTNASGDPEQTTYRGTLRPGELLGGGTTFHSAEIYAQSGCAGRCHQGPHGSVTRCVSCHDFRPSEPEVPHGTHSTLVGGEESQANPGDWEPNNPQTGCKYCHKPTSGTNTRYRASCWNCHLSAHNPITPYWELPG